LLRRRASAVVDDTDIAAQRVPAVQGEAVNLRRQVRPWSRVARLQPTPRRSAKHPLGTPSATTRSLAVRRRTTTSSAGAGPRFVTATR